MFPAFYFLSALLLVHVKVGRRIISGLSKCERQQASRRLIYKERAGARRRAWPPDCKIGLAPNAEVVPACRLRCMTVGLDLLVLAGPLQYPAPHKWNFAKLPIRAVPQMHC